MAPIRGDIELGREAPALDICRDERATAPDSGAIRDLFWYVAGEISGGVSGPFAPFRPTRQPMFLPDTGSFCSGSCGDAINSPVRYPLWTRSVK